MLILNRDHNSVERILIKETSKHTFHFTAFTRIYTSAPLIIAAKSIYSDSSDAIIEQQHKCKTVRIALESLLFFFKSRGLLEQYNDIG